MNTIVNRKAIVSSKLLSSKVLSFLFAIAVVLHVVAQAISREHPILAMLLAMLEALSWIFILMMGVTWLIKAIKHGLPLAWHTLWTFVRTHIRFKKAQKKEAYASLEQLKHLRNNIQRLGLALHGLTPEMEQARRTHFQMLGEAVPALALPAQNAVLYAQFESLVRYLNHFGFPNLESARLQQKDLDFAQEWGCELEARLLQAQKDYNYQLQAMQWLLDEASKKFERIGSKYQQAQNDAGYQRIHGALKLLTKMASDSHRPEEMIGYLTALLKDMESLRTQLKQAAV